MKTPIGLPWAVTAMSWVVGAVIVVLIIFNALYVAGEFAAVAARRGRVRERADEGNRQAARLLPILEDTSRLDSYIATCQIGITVSSLVLGAYGQFALTPALAPLLVTVFDLASVTALSSAAITVLVGLTATQVVLGELVPKSLALQFPTRTALATVRPVQWSTWLFTPFIWMLNGSALGILRAMRVPPGGHRHVHSPEEIEMLVAESRDGGLLEPAEHKRLAGALHLRQRPARALMVPLARIVGVDLHDPPERVVQTVAEVPYTRIPVYDREPHRLVGFLHTKDVFLGRDDRVDDVAAMMRPIERVPHDLPGDKVLSALRDAHAEIAIVVDGEGAALGIVTFEDVLAEMLGGRIGTLSSVDLEPQSLSDGRIRLPGLLPLLQAPAWLRPEHEVESATVGGLVTEVFGRTPREGEHVRVGGAEIEVERMAAGRVESVVVSPPAKSVKGGGPDG